MKLPLQVSFHGIDRSEALENLIAKEVEGLHKFDADLISCRVAVESEGRHQNQGRECSVRVSLNAPGHEFIMNTKNEDAHAAVRDRKSTRLNSSHNRESRMPSSA